MITHNFISSNPKISVKFCGQGDLILFLHGIGGNKNNWNDNLQYFSKDFLSVAWDTRGYGESDDYDGPLKFEDVVEDLKKVITHFKKTSAHIVGLSMGGQIACLFYQKYPSFVKSLVLCDTHFGLSKLDKNQVNAFIESRKKPLLNGFEPKDIALNVSKSLIGDTTNKVALEKLVESISILHKESYLKTIDASFMCSHEEVFKLIEKPTLIIVGEKDSLTPVSMSKNINKLIRNSKLKIIKKVGHLTNIENPEEFNKIVFNFLKNMT